MKTLAEEIFENPPRWQVTHSGYLTYLGQQGAYDLYYNANGNTLLARYGSEPSQCHEVATKQQTLNFAITEAKRRAKELGLI